MSSPEPKVPVKKDKGSDLKASDTPLRTEDSLQVNGDVRAEVLFPLTQLSSTKSPGSIDADSPTLKVAQPTLDALHMGEVPKSEGTFDHDFGFGGFDTLDEVEKDPVAEEKSAATRELDDTARMVNLLTVGIGLKTPGDGLEKLKVIVAAVLQEISQLRSSLAKATKAVEAEGVFTAARELKTSRAKPLLVELARLPDAYPRSWLEFSDQFHAKFKSRLCPFRGGSEKTPDILKPNSGFRGGEGQLFLSEKNPKQALKRWFTTQLPQMNRSVTLLLDARKCIDGNKDLQSFLEIVDVFEHENDWILRGFDPDSIPLQKAIQDQMVITCKEKALSALVGKEDPISTELRRKLEGNSANLHWSPTLKKILVIDMM